jgi:hypothetical protein
MVVVGEFRYFSTPELRKPGWRWPARAITTRASGGFGHRRFGVWRLRKCVRGSFELQKSTDGMWLASFA